ncbi:MAG: tryptophan synthase subunit alpha [Planctomycetota bacterium]
MSRINDIFSDAKSQGRKLLMPFFVGGHPVGASTGALLDAIERGGGAIAEIGIPFSDPIADGPVIASAMHAALTAGVTPEQVFGEIAEARSELSIGVVAMCSVSIASRMGGPAAFAKRAAESGIDGLILPDAPLEEAAEFTQAASEAGLTATLLVSPSTPPDRAAAIAEACSGFVYLLARAGVTGESDAAPDIAGSVAPLKNATPLPIAVGFGIGSAEQVRTVVKHADAAIVGSALVRRLSTADDPVAEAESFTTSLAVGLA